MTNPAETRENTPISLKLVIWGMWLLFFHEVLKSFGVIKMPVAYTGFFLLFGALAIELKNGALTLVSAQYRLWIAGIFYFSLYALLYGILQSHTLQFISRDIWPYGYFACLFVAARAKTWHALDKMIYRQFLTGLVIFLYVLATTNITTLTRAAFELNTASYKGPSVWLAWGLLCGGWQYMFLSFNKDQSISRKMVAFLGVAFLLVFGIIMLKRQIVMEVVILTIFKLIYVVKAEKASVVKWVTIFIAIGAVAFSILMFYEARVNVHYFKDLGSRSTESGSILATTLQNTRFIEQPLNIYNQASGFEVLFGQGLGSSVKKDGVIDTVVESGLLTVFMKGGVAYLMIWCFGFFFILRDTALGGRSDKLLFRLLSTMFIIISPAGPFFIDHFATGYKMFWLGRCASRVKATGGEAQCKSFASLGDFA